MNEKLVLRRRFARASFWTIIAILLSFVVAAFCGDENTANTIKAASPVLTLAIPSLVAVIWKYFDTATEYDKQ